ncbi:hypothetical protein Drorol1_Dr00019747 [Drosera rotundifolia]
MVSLNEEAIDVDSANSLKSSPVANSPESYAASVKLLTIGVLMLQCSSLGILHWVFSGCSSMLMLT